MSQIVMRCAAPIMTASGVQRYKPGDFLPVGHPDAGGWEWAEFIAADDVTFAEPAADAPGPVSEPAPDPTPEPEVVTPVLSDSGTGTDSAAVEF